MTPLSDVEARILGSLVEKSITTPEYYPPTLNSLTDACNQKSNRAPVVSYEEATVVRGLDLLKDKALVQMIQTPGGRAPKYRHSFMEALNLIPAEAALLCELMLRGPQTAGELKAHAARLHVFNGPEEVEETLRELIEREPPVLSRLPRQPGRKENRYAHLLCGEPSSVASCEEQTLRPETAALRVRSEDERLGRLEEEAAALRREVEALKREFETFKRQFE